MKGQSKYYYILALFLGCTLIACQRGKNNTTATTTTGESSSSTVDNTNSPTTDSSVEGDTANALPAYDPSVPPREEEMSFNVIVNADGTLGYEIFRSGRLVVRQETIPTEGATGFTEKMHAAKTAQLVISKMMQGIDPPRVSKKEIKEILSSK